MGRIWVVGASAADGRVQALDVELDGLGRRVIDRDTMVAWLNDGHSFVPRSAGGASRALQRVEVDGEVYLRDDHQAEAGDALPELPAPAA